MDSRLLVAILLGAIVVAASIVCAVFWECLLSPAVDVSVRDVLLSAAGLGAAVIAWWRGVIADQHQQTARRQEEIDVNRLATERFQKAGEMLGHRETPVRIAGLSALTYLAITELEANENSVYRDMVLDVLRKFSATRDVFPNGDDKKVADRCIALLQGSSETRQ